MGTSDILLDRSKTTKTMNADSSYTGPAFIPPLRAELDRYREEMCQLQGHSPRDVFALLSAWHARAVAIRAQAYQYESRAATAFRTREVEPFIEACDFQFRVWSRMQAVDESEMRLARGGV